MQHKLGLGLLLSLNLLAALPSTTVWEVRPTVGSDTTAGVCFDSTKSGTDYSQQNSAQYNFTDLASTNGTNTSPQVTSASHNFVSADVGNCIHVTAGTNWTTGYYECVSASANACTLDRAVGSSATLSSGTYYVGGAGSTISNVNSNWQPNNIMWVKASGTYTVTSALQVALDSHQSPGNPASIIGYTSTRGDGGQFTWTTSTNSIDLIDFSPSTSPTVNFLLENINFTTSAVTKGDALKSSGTSVNTVNVAVINCTITGFAVGIEGNAAIDGAFVGLQLINSRVTGNSSHGVRNGIASTYVLGSMLDNNGGDGFTTGASDAISGQPATYIFEDTIAYKNGGNGFNVSYSDATTARAFFFIFNHCISSTNTSAGILLAGGTTNPLAQISNSILDANGTYGVDGGSGTVTQSSLVYDNAFYNNTTAPTRNINSGIGTITLTASPYTTIGSNFALNSTTGGGALLKGVGFPGTTPGGTGHVDVGPLQSTSSGGQKGFAIIQ